jgi:hypothetical protein
MEKVPSCLRANGLHLDYLISTTTTKRPQFILVRLPTDTSKKSGQPYDVLARGVFLVEISSPTARFPCVID